MKSMTAYGYAEFQNENYLMTMELKSYNNRFLEISYFGPPYLSAYESTITDLIKQHAQRGHVDISVKVKNIRSNVDVNVDKEVVESYLKAFREIRDLGTSYALEIQTRRGDVVSQDGVLSSIRTDGIEAYQEGLDYCSKIVLQQFDDAKTREGEITKRDLSAMVDSIAKSLETVKANVGKLEEM
ncbi:MAG: hypothetical protein ILP16_07620, partial [Spirochaetales bacterium]|nr:hypothetical protein [Spirochaetales bacterium]